MKIIIFGLGHIGIVATACLLREGHFVVGVETNDDIRACVGRGMSPFREPGVAALIATGHAAGRLSVRMSVGDAINADLAFVCVNTSMLTDGTLDLSDVTAVARHLGEAIRQRSPELAPMLIVFQSTMLPGSMNQTVLPAIVNATGDPPGTRYDVVYNPTFTREGSAVADYYAPARVIIGEHQPGNARALLDLLEGIDAPILTTSFEVAELTKFADNAFHALKVAFANEIGRFALRSDISPNEVFDLFQADTKLNLSASYLRPGGPFGGPCLPKDVRALSGRMNEVGISAPIIGHLLESNSSHTDFLIAEIERRTEPRSRILLVGLSFKSGTDDVRASPLVRLAELLLDHGHELSIYDPDVVCDNTAGASAQLPSRVSAALLSRLSAGAHWDLVVVGKTTPDILRLVGPTRAFFQFDQL